MTSLRIVVAFILILAHGKSAEAATYVCDVLANYEVDDEGFLPRRDDMWIDLSNRFVFDESTGVLSRERMAAIRMILLQAGSPQNSSLARYELQGPAAYVLVILRINTWREPISFLLDDQGLIFSGICSRVGRTD